MVARRHVLLGGLAALIAAPAAAQDRIKAVASFSILGDLVRNVGGDRVEVAALVGPNSDAHVFSPTPADVRKLGAAKLVVVNGLGLEGWMTRLVKASSSKAPVVVASRGIATRTLEGAIDPHAWQSVANVKIYVANIRDGLIKADPPGRSAYEATAADYLGKLDALERDVRAAIGQIPAERRKIITTHDAFGYFGAAYGLALIAPEGVSTDTEPSARDVARIITQIKREKIPALFMENIVDPRLMQQIARETGAKVGGTLYSDALSDPAGPAPTYIDMMRHNIRELSKALTP
jgi:zinc/manganese transport system substrate-binding protein